MSLTRQSLLRPSPHATNSNLRHHNLQCETLGFTTVSSLPAIHPFCALTGVSQHANVPRSLTRITHALPRARLASHRSRFGEPLFDVNALAAPDFVLSEPVRPKTAMVLVVDDCKLTQHVICSLLKVSLMRTPARLPHTVSQYVCQIVNQSDVPAYTSFYRFSNPSVCPTLLPL
jgi:hypothetical protein